VSIPIDHYPSDASVVCPMCFGSFTVVDNIHHMIRDNAALLRCPHCSDIIWVDNDADEDEEVPEG
jgi:uncharacterized protein YbaR (Trm112 family)